MSNQVPQSLKKMLFEGQITGLTDTFKIILMVDGFPFVPAIHNAYADVVASEMANGLGYTTGGETLAGVSIDVNDANKTATISWNSISWTADDGSIEASGAVIYDDSTDDDSDDYTDAIVGYIDFGETITITNGLILRIYNICIVI